MTRSHIFNYKKTLIVLSVILILKVLTFLMKLWQHRHTKINNSPDLVSTSFKTQDGTKLITLNMKISELAKIKDVPGSRDVKTPKMITFSVITMTNNVILIILDLVIVKLVHSHKVTNVNLSMFRRIQTVVKLDRTAKIR